VEGCITGINKPFMNFLTLRTLCYENKTDARFDSKTRPSKRASGSVIKDKGGYLIHLKIAPKSWSVLSIVSTSSNLLHLLQFPNLNFAVFLQMN
jgi:hypothetical protein